MVRNEGIDQSEPKQCTVEKARIIYFQHASSDANVDLDLINREKKILLRAAKKLGW